MRRPPFSEHEARRAVAGALCWADALRALGYRPVGHNFRTLQRWVRRWSISTAHFDANAARRRANCRHRVPLAEVLVADSSYMSRGNLKRRLFEAGLKERRCELCGQSQIWRGRPMALILDHINGVPTDNRIQNLRIVCPNCAATFDTHCGRNLPRRRECVGCGRTFAPRTIQQRYCSFSCFTGARTRNAGKPTRSSTFGVPQPSRRKVERPPYEQLVRELEGTSYLAVGRKYGVSDNAVRKWILFYERERERLEREAQQSDEREAA
jgi:hypothetical protein